MSDALNELGLESHSFDGAAGTLYVSRRGEGVPLVMLHSLAMSSQMWAPIVPDFLASHDVYALDVRGHGHSSWTGESFSVADMAEDVRSLLDHQNIDEANILGLSMGGSVALTFAGTYPERVSKLVLCDTTAWYGPNAVEAWKERSETAESVPRPSQIPFQLDRWFSKDFQAANPDTVKLFTEVFEQTDSNVHKQACLALGAFDSRSLLTRITAPTFVLTGNEDKATPVAMGQTIADKVPDAVFKVVSGGHFAIFESDEARVAISSFLSE